MATPNTGRDSSFTELVTTTFDKHKKKIADNLTTRNAFLKAMSRRGNKRTEDGGLTIVEPLDYAANGTYLRYSDWDTLDISQSEVISAAQYQWRQIAINVVASGREIRINSGESRVVNLVQARMKNAIRTYQNNFCSDLYSDGSLTNQIGGLQTIVADVNTNTVGGINASTFSFWQNTVKDASVLGVTTGPSTIEGSLMLPLWLDIDRGMDDSPDLIIMDTVYYKHFENSQVSLKRYAPVANANAGFAALRYKNAEVIFDGNSGIPASHAYFLNTNYLKLVVHRDCDMEVMPRIRPVNQDGEVVAILWMGNICCSNRKQQGVIIE